MKAILLVLTTAASLAIPAAVRAETPPPLSASVAAETRQQIAKNAEIKGDIARGQAQFGSAETWYSLAIRNNPHDATLYNKVGIVEMKLGDMNRARKDFAQAIRLDPSSVDALNNLGAVDCLQHKYRPAVRYLKEALALDESRATTHLNLAEAWMGQKQIDRAMTEYARALELDADILNSTDKEGVFAQVTTPEQRAMIDFMIAKAYMKRGNQEGALDYLRQAKEGHFKDLASVYTDPIFSPLWKDPRLADIVKR